MGVCFYTVCKEDLFELLFQFNVGLSIFTKHSGCKHLECSKMLVWWRRECLAHTLSLSVLVGTWNVCREKHLCVVAPLALCLLRESMCLWAVLATFVSTQQAPTKFTFSFASTPGRQRKGFFFFFLSLTRPLLLSAFETLLLHQSGFRLHEVVDFLSVSSEPQFVKCLVYYSLCRRRGLQSLWSVFCFLP